MDKRELKKQILFLALDRLLDMEEYGMRSDVGFILEKNDEDVTDPEFNRYLNLLQEMADNAESKLE